MPFIRNHLKSVYIVPAVSKVGEIGTDPIVVFPAITLNPGASAHLDDAHLAEVRKGNVPFDYMLSQGLLKVTDSENSDPHVLLRDVDSPEPPAYLVDEKQEADEKANRTSKVDVTTVDLAEDKPKTSGKRK